MKIIAKGIIAAVTASILVATGPAAEARGRHHHHWRGHSAVAGSYDSSAPTAGELFFGHWGAEIGVETPFGSVETGIGYRRGPTASEAAYIRQAAAELGANPQDLTKVIWFETGGTFSPAIWGGRGHRYLGEIQFGPRERRQYGVSAHQSFGEQILCCVVAYLKDRGYRPGMGLMDLYSTVLAGRPGLYHANDGHGSVAHDVWKMSRMRFVDGGSVYADRHHRHQRFGLAAWHRHRLERNARHRWQAWRHHERHRSELRADAGDADGGTAVYDISAHEVSLPDGSRLEAHSGRSYGFDDPEFAHEHRIGPTPPGLYALAPRKGLFHGVPALRLISLNGKTFGRGGLLAHSFMLGQRGESLGCVSFKNYRAFLSAYRRGEVRRLKVVASR